MSDCSGRGERTCGVATAAAPSLIGEVISVPRDLDEQEFGEFADGQLHLADVSSYSQVLKCLKRRIPSSPVRKNGCRHGETKRTATRNHERDSARRTHSPPISLGRRHIHAPEQPDTATRAM